jgi:Protein of unknown function (DUF3141)
MNVQSDLRANPESRSCFYLILICINECPGVSNLVWEADGEQSMTVKCSPRDFRAEVNTPANGGGCSGSLFCHDPDPGPGATRILEELSGQFGKLAPIAFHEYMRDFWQRSVLFLDVLRQRGNQRKEMLAHGISSVLIYDSELVMRGDNRRVSGVL